MAIRRRLHAQGLRFRVNARPLRAVRRTADIVFGPTKVAVFIDGCFWHACPDHYSEPKSNVDYWRPKIARNIERDLEINELLIAEGWEALRFWSHEEPMAVADAVAEAVLERRASGDFRHES